MPDQNVVMVVEDHGDSRRSLCRLLEHDGYGVVGVADAQQARAYLADSPRTPSVIVLDLWLPGENGMEWLEWLRRDGGRAASTKVLVYSAAPRKDYEPKVRALGADEYLEKPANLTELRQIVMRLAQHSSKMDTTKQQ